MIIADGDGGELRPGQEGEILVRGPNVMRGYLGDADATRAALDPDGWACTPATWDARTMRVLCSSPAGSRS